MQKLRTAAHEVEGGVLGYTTGEALNTLKYYKVT